MSNSSDAMFSLSTEVKPPKVFAIDGDSYILKDLVHLSDVDEGHFRVLVEKESRNSRLLTAAVERGDEVQANKIGMSIRGNREALIEIFTDIPMTVIQKLGPVNQGTLVQAIMQGPEIVRDRLQKEAEREAEREAGLPPEVAALAPEAETESAA